MTALPLARPLARRTINPWLVAVAVVIPTFMEVLDTTIANVALRYIAGGLSSPPSDGEWVITSYLAANAIILPISGYLGMRLGRRNYFLFSIALFTIASALCGMASSLGMLIAFRVLQGIAGGGLQPVSQGILLDAFPPSKHGAAMTVFGIAALIAPVLGPSLGGYITDNFGWRWIFYLNIPVGLFAFLLCRALVSDPEYLKVQRAAARGQTRFDGLGLALLSITTIAWEILLQRPGMGLAGRSLSSHPLPRLHLCRRTGQPGHPRNAHPQSPDQFPHPARSQFPRLLPHYLLRLRRPLCQHHLAPRPVAISLWL